MTKQSKIRRDLRHLLEQFTRRTARETREVSVAEVLEPRSVPRMAWINFKTRATHSGGRSGISGHGPEFAEAFVENASRTFAKEIQKVTLEKANENIAEVNAAIAARHPRAEQPPATGLPWDEEDEQLLAASMRDLNATADNL